MPKTGPDHNAIIALLKQRGICEEAERINTHKAADTIWEHLQTIIIKLWSHSELSVTANPDQVPIIHNTVRPSGIGQSITQSQGTSKRRRLTYNVNIPLQSTDMDASMTALQPASQNINAGIKELLTAIGIHQTFSEIAHSTED